MYYITNICFRLSPFLYDLAHLNPQNASSVTQEIIKEKHKDFEKNKKKYPDLDTVCSIYNYVTKYIFHGINYNLLTNIFFFSACFL